MYLQRCPGSGTAGPNDVCPLSFDVTLTEELLVSGSDAGFVQALNFACVVGKESSLVFLDCA
jgi:hypothetical protein